jgi:hypothetical protein
MRRALLIGIDDYPNAPLTGCVNDAIRLEAMLSRNEDDSPNFTSRLVTAPHEEITRASLREKIIELFHNPADMALFYFSGHGAVDTLGGYISTPDGMEHDEGIPMNDLIARANASDVKEITVILDCCFSGAAGDKNSAVGANTELRQGVSILTASRGNEPAYEENNGGAFTNLVIDALAGGAADVVGNVNVASIYGFVDQALGAWDQRPLFKSYVSTMQPIRKCVPAVPLHVLRLISSYFPLQDHEFQLDPSYEPDSQPESTAHEAIFQHLQQYNRARLLVPVEEDHMYFAAIRSKRCRLTPLGRFYWYLAKEGKI